MSFFKQHPTLPGFGLSFGVSALFITLVILVPLAGLLAYLSNMSGAQFLAAVTDPRVVASYRVTLTGAAYSTLIALVVGLLLAWVLVRYRFPGRELLDALVDLPFALPTAVAGLTLSVLLAPNGWVGQWLAPFDIKVSYAFPGLVIAMVFTSLPFVVRSVQPVLAEMGPEYEEASHTLGANDWQTTWRVILPALVPAIFTGASQAFIRSLGEFGAVVMIAGNIPYKTEITSLMIFVRLSEYDYAAASAIASVVLGASLLLLFLLQVLQGRLLPWQRPGV
ncbi:sulfate ABC transporter permease subunit CysT [Alcaligenaceae bacterium A4P071]|nr:sulfate ABC transporter permease subunit CysT [Alcaligenaceae bacterium B3P038]MDQ2147460.1 sulfate ABC transporter permease subunit CysT [Alcaligenaceae bacterium C4P045]MDQ2184791.1 sulfate ABC transporter permease subunit CysT [Alcaligenaceae bacterium A4P071]